MGEALLSGLLAAGDAVSVRIVEALEERRRALASVFPAAEITDSVGPSVGTVIAVKPHQVAEVAAAAAQAGVERILSIAAGVTVATIEAAVDDGAVAVIRAMPNTPALVGRGAAVIAAGTGASERDMAWAESVLGSVGLVERAPEDLLDAVTGLSGSGPAYVFLMLEAMIDGGVAAGLSRPVAERLAGQTLLGAASLYLASDASPADLRDQVTSPGGTTAAGLAVLEQRGFAGAVVDAVVAARDRSVELGAD